MFCILIDDENFIKRSKDTFKRYLCVKFAKRILMLLSHKNFIVSSLNSLSNINKFYFRLGEVLEIVDDLVIDIPKIWTYLAEILCK